jgi:hypothetical protein
MTTYPGLSPLAAYPCEWPRFRLTPVKN